MFKVASDRSTNRLYITLWGILSKDEAKAAYANIVREVGKLKPGFDVINDISQLIKADWGGIKTLREIMAFLRNREVRAVIRVVGSSKNSLLQFAKATLGFLGYKPRFVPSLKEAEEVIAELNTKREEVLA
jgi:ADP-heptose:LPS heptosyltransferase